MLVAPRHPFRCCALPVGTWCAARRPESPRAGQSEVTSPPCAVWWGQPFAADPWSPPVTASCTAVHNIHCHKYSAQSQAPSATFLHYLYSFLVSGRASTIGARLRGPFAPLRPRSVPRSVLPSLPVRRCRHRRAPPGGGRGARCPTSALDAHPTGGPKATGSAPERPRWAVSRGSASLPRVHINRPGGRRTAASRPAIHRQARPAALDTRSTATEAASALRHRPGRTRLGVPDPLIAASTRSRQRLDPPSCPGRRVRSRPHGRLSTRPSRTDQARPASITSSPTRWRPSSARANAETPRDPRTPPHTPRERGQGGERAPSVGDTATQW